MKCSRVLFFAIAAAFVGSSAYAAAAPADAAADTGVAAAAVVTTETGAPEATCPVPLDLTPRTGDSSAQVSLPQVDAGSFEGSQKPVWLGGCSGDLCGCFNPPCSEECPVGNQACMGECRREQKRCAIACCSP